MENDALAPEARTKNTWAASLAWSMQKLGEPRTQSDPKRLRSLLRSFGTEAQVRPALEAIVAGPRRARAIDFAASLGGLTLHFWRPDFTEEQAELLYGDFRKDLAEATADELAAACERYRLDPANDFFPTPGKLLALLREAWRDRQLAARGARMALDALDIAEAAEAEPISLDRMRAIRSAAKKQNSQEGQ